MERVTAVYLAPPTYAAGYAAGLEAGPAGEALKLGRYYADIHALLHPDDDDAKADVEIIDAAIRALRASGVTEVDGETP
jgi:hypothetical protein